ncbi:hypothetical protein [Halomonas elongata]|uniref:hypothetical protein n=1 Tax=Halomonas elongata TaxID=2746 RepID=UPI0040346E6A
MDVMDLTDTISLQENLSTLGYVLLKGWKPGLTTEDTAGALGISIDIATRLPNSGIPNVQTLTPKNTDLALKNQYSGTFGFGEFPFHSDLAHWSVPPRYFMLRCVQGSPTVATQLLHVDKIIETIGVSVLRKAVLLPRRRTPNSHYCLLPLSFQRSEVAGIRWDPLFLRPYSDAAVSVGHALANQHWGESLRSVVLEGPGDTLIVDNWRILHGRSAIDAKSTERKLERIYLDKIKGYDDECYGCE